ncbi:hypothetical protein [Halalkalibacter urbisdiaboli]|uniref:hypothetical protein n=1 Tax=Halalkalibacter urbisdiaboli TaxID=1960589 RepID=UPI000B435F73|nr:hypothetical protein [Halalkalibacter urbisdiaboli]
MQIDTNFKLEVLPERLYALLKLVEYKQYTREELRHLVQPLNNEGELSKVLSYAKTCGWVSENSDGKYGLKIEKGDIQSIQTFRRKLNSILFSGDKTIFYVFTEWVVGQDEKLLGIKVNDYTKQNPALVQEGNPSFHLQWRLWAVFLGIGNLHNKVFVPNSSLRIKDIIQYFAGELAIDKPVPLQDFFAWLKNKCPEFKGCLKDNSISVFLSMALRDLHDQGVIKLEYHQDYVNIWSLTPSVFHEVDQRATHIKIRGEHFE